MELNSTVYLSFIILSNLQQFSLYCLDWSYRQHQISASYFTFGGMFYTTKTICPAVVHIAGHLRDHFMYIIYFSRIAVVQKVKEPLPWCDLWDMQMPAGRLINHQRTRRCNRNMHMQWKRRDVTIASRCAEASFSLTGEDEAELIEGVETFNYLGWMLDR